MAITDSELRKANQIFDAVVDLLPEVGIKKFDPNRQDLKITFSVTGDDFPMKFVWRIKPKQELISILSPFTFNFREDKIMDGMIALTAINYSLLNGSFDLDMSDGTVFFRINTSFTGTTITKDLLDYLVRVSANTVDNYSYRLFALNKGISTLEEFLEWFHKDD